MIRGERPIVLCTGEHRDFIMKIRRGEMEVGGIGFLCGYLLSVFIFMYFLWTMSSFCSLSSVTAATSSLIHTSPAI